MTPSPALAAATPEPVSARPGPTVSWLQATRDPVPGTGVAGVYILWRTGRSPRECLVVGETRDIASDLARSFRESHIADYAATGALEVSWAAVASMHRPGIASFLTGALAPRLSGPSGAARQIAVNLPV